MMESLDGTEWDVVLAGTSLPESLLALALSRSGKRILHVDRNQYYGGSEAALSLQDAEEWVTSIHTSTQYQFSNATITSASSTADGQGSQLKLAFPRAYSLALAPNILYNFSSLLPVLVSARVDQQLEFLALGSWWLFSANDESEDTGQASGGKRKLNRIPSGREDVFADDSIDGRSKRSLMKFLRFVVDFDDQTDVWEPYSDQAFSHFLETQYSLSAGAVDLLHAITLSSLPPSKTTTSYALPRIARHLRSIGLFGPAFGAVIPKWGGLSELAQIACRACAVGGGTYVLGTGLETVGPPTSAPKSLDSDDDIRSSVTLKNGNQVRSKHIFAGIDNTPTEIHQTDVSTSKTQLAPLSCSKSICVVSSPLLALFPSLGEGAPTPAGAVVVCPGSTSDDAPVHVFVHSSETGECPSGQCILYCSFAKGGDQAFEILDATVNEILEAVDEQPTPKVLWKLQYTQTASDHAINRSSSGNVLQVLPSMSLDLAFDDSILPEIKEAWHEVMGVEAEGFMTFPEREGMGEEYDEE